MITNEQIVETSNANLETATVLGTTAFSGVEKLVDLNAQTFKTSLSEAGEAATAASSVRTMDQFIALRNSIVNPMGGKLTSYARHVFDIFSQTSAEMTQVFEDFFAERQRKVAAAVDAAAKKASDVAAANILTLTTEATKAARVTKTVAAA